MRTGIIIVFACGLAFTIILSIFVINYASGRKDMLKSYIGTKCIYKGDTSTVVSYDYWRGDLFLDRGYHVSPEYVDQNKVNE